MVNLLASLLCLLMAQEAPTAPVHFGLEVERVQTESVLSSGASVYVGETLWVKLHIEMEQEFFEQQLLPQWRSPLDFQAELSTPWATPSSGFQILEEGELGQTSLVVDREEGFIQKMETADDGRIHFQLRRKIQLQEGSFQLPPARLKLAWATEFEDDMIRGRIALDRQTKVFTTQAFQLEVLPIPLKDQPLDFYGAVGDFRMDLSEDSSLGTRALQIHFGGSGLLTPDHLPRVGQLSNFQLSAQRLEQKADGITMHLETLSEDPFPFLSWSFFQPKTASYITRTIGKESPVETGLTTEGRKWTPWIWLAAFTSLLLAAFYWPKSKSAEDDKKMEAKAVLKKPEDLVDDLAQLLNCSREDIYASDLATRLSQAGMDGALATDCSSAIHAIFQARYADRGSAPSEADLTALRKRLQAGR